MNFLTVEEAESRINAETNHQLERILRPKIEGKGRPITKAKNPNAGRREGEKDIPEYLRELIATSAKISGVRSTARSFGVSPVTAQNAKNGVRSVRTNSDGTRNVIVDKTLQEKTRNRMSRIVDLATTIIEGNLPRLSDELEAVTDKPKERASILKDIAIIAEKAMPTKEEANHGPNVAFIFFKPEEKKFDDVPIIDVTPIAKG